MVAYSSPPTSLSYFVTFLLALYSMISTLKISLLSLLSVRCTLVLWVNYPTIRGLTLQEYSCLTNQLFSVFHSGRSGDPPAVGGANSKSNRRYNCGISFDISRRLMFLPMQVRAPEPNFDIPSEQLHLALLILKSKDRCTQPKAMGSRYSPRRRIAPYLKHGP